MKKKYPIRICAILGLLLLTSATFAQRSTDRAAALVDEGIDLQEAEKYKEAIQKYNAALLADPGYQKANYAIANALYTQEKYDAAIVYAKKVIDANTTYVPEAYQLLGLIYEDMENVAKALAMYKKGIGLYPKNIKLRNALVSFYYKKNQYAEAEAEVRNALKLESEDKQSRWLYAAIVNQQKRAMPAIVGFCSYLLKDNESEDSYDAMSELRDLLTGNGKNEINTYAQFEKLLQANLNQAASDKVMGQYDDTYRYFAAFLGELVASPQFPAFARYISISQFTEENKTWFKAAPMREIELDGFVMRGTKKF